MNLIETEWPEPMARLHVVAVFKQILYLLITGVKHIRFFRKRSFQRRTSTRQKFTIYSVLEKAFDATLSCHMLSSPCIAHHSQVSINCKTALHHRQPI